MDEDKDIKQMVSEMHKALIGDEYRKEGIIHKIDNHEKRLGRIEKYVVGLSAIGAFIYATIKIGSGILEMIK